MTTSDPKFDKLSDALDVDNEIESNHLPMPWKSREVVEMDDADIIEEDSTLEDDFKLARDNILEMMDAAKIALEDVIALGRSLESARPYEVANQLIQNVVNANKDLIEMHKKVNEIKSKSKQKEESEEEIEQINQTTNIQNNIVFTGTTADIQRLIKETINTKK